MSVSTPIKAAFETARILPFSVITGSFVSMGDPLAHPAYALVITSTLAAVPESGVTPISVWISLDGVNLHILALGQQTTIINAASNKQGTASLAFPKGTRFYVFSGQEGDPESGFINLTPLYASS